MKVKNINGSCFKSNNMELYHIEKTLKKSYEFYY